MTDSPAPSLPPRRFPGTRLIFGLSALYDGVLGLAFLLAAPGIFQRLGTPPPNHWGYVIFPALMLIVFALMFAAVAVRPVAYRHYILPGVGLKLAFAGTVIFYWATSGVPVMWQPFAVVDLGFAALFLASRFGLPGRR